MLFQLTGALDGRSLAERDGRTLRAYADFSLYVFSRMYSVFGGMLQVACSYAVLRMIAGRYAALCAGLLVAVSFTLVQHAHYIKPGSLATGWMMLAAWACFAALYARRHSRRVNMWLLACIATGLASSTRYNALAVVPIVLATGMLLVYRHRSRSMARAAVLGLLLAPLVFALGSPYVLRDFEHFWRDFTRIVGQFTSTGVNVADYFLVDHDTGLVYLLMYAALFALGIPALAAALLSFIPAWKSRPSGNFFRRNSLSLSALLIALVVLLYGLVALRTIRPGHSDNLLMLVLPFAAMLSAIGADWLARAIKLPKWLTMPLVALVLVIQPLVLSVQVVKMFKQPDTRHIMLEWIHERIPRGSRFFLNGSYNVALDEALYPSVQQSNTYAETLPEGDDADYMIYSDALAFDILRSKAIVPAEIVQQQRDYLRLLDQTYKRVAEVSRPAWTGAEAMMNMATFWHNPTLILYCVNPARCETGG